MKLKTIYDYAYRFIMLLCKLLLVADIAITSMAVLGRYVPVVPDPAWSEEIVLTCMIYMALLSAALAIRRRAHIRMTALDMYLPQKAVQILDVFGDLLVLIFALVMVIVGWNYAVDIGGKSMYTSLPWLSKFWLYVPVPFAGLAMVMFQTETLVYHIKTLTRKVGEAGWK